LRQSKKWGELVDLHALPKVRDSWSFLYVEHCRIEQEEKAIAVHDKRGRTPVPCASLATLFLGPGTSITHAAVRALADNGCLVVWSGEDNVRFYAVGMGETRNAANLLHQARTWADPEVHLQVVRRLYEIRFEEPLPPSATLRQIRGLEGMRVRRAYAVASAATGVPWQGRSYKRGEWHKADHVNRALSQANSYLYGVCHAAIVSAGFSPALGFIHTGKMLSFVYDVADLYKTSVSVPAAFRAASEGPIGLSRRVRLACREAFVESRLLQRIIPDIHIALGMARTPEERDALLDQEEMRPGNLWDPDVATVPGGINYVDAGDNQEEGIGTEVEE
jgi:CRISPR-associated protein Cas1